MLIVLRNLEKTCNQSKQLYSLYCNIKLTKIVEFINRNIIFNILDYI